jgi:hypothetical protein
MKIVALFCILVALLGASATLTCCDNCQNGGTSVLDISNTDNAATVLDSIETHLFTPAGQPNPCKKKYVCRASKCLGNPRCKRSVFVDLQQAVTGNSDIRQIWTEVCVKRLYVVNQRENKFSRKFRKIVGTYLGFEETHFEKALKPKRGDLYDELYINTYLKQVLASRPRSWNVAQTLYLYKQGIDKYLIRTTRKDFVQSWDLAKKLTAFEAEQLKSKTDNVWKKHDVHAKNITGKFIPMYTDMAKDLVEFYSSVYDAEGASWCNCADFGRYYAYWSDPATDLTSIKNLPPPKEFEVFRPFLETLKNTTTNYCKTCKRVISPK